MNKYLSIMLIFFLGVILGVIVGVMGVISFQNENFEEEFELTNEMKPYADKLDEKGYLTEEDLKEMRKIQRRYKGDFFSE